MVLSVFVLFGFAHLGAADAAVFLAVSVDGGTVVNGNVFEVEGDRRVHTRKL